MHGIYLEGLYDVVKEKEAVVRINSAQDNDVQKDPGSPSHDWTGGKESPRKISHIRLK